MSSLANRNESLPIISFMLAEKDNWPGGSEGSTASFRDGGTGEKLFVLIT